MTDPIYLLFPTFSPSDRIHQFTVFLLISESSLLVAPSSRKTLNPLRQRPINNIQLLKALWGKGEIVRNEQFLLFPQCLLLNQTVLFPFVHIFDIISLLAA